MSTLLERVVEELRDATGVQVSYGRAVSIEGTIIILTQDETSESTMFAERGFDIDIFAPGPDPEQVERLRRTVERTLHYWMVGETDDTGAARLRIESQSYVEEDEDWSHWTIRAVARIFRLDAARSHGSTT